MGSKQPDEFYDWVKKVQHNERITAFNDVNFSPVLVSDAAQILIKLADSKVTGVWHLTAKDQLAYTDAIKLLLDRLGLNSSLVQQVSSADIGLSRKFTQRHSVLECSKLCDSFDQELYTSKEVLERISYQYTL